MGRYHGTLIDNDFSALSSGTSPVPISESRRTHRGYQRNRAPLRQAQLQQLLRRLWPRRLRRLPTDRVHPFAWTALAHLDRLGYRPLLGQVAVGDLRCRLGTACDAVWCHRTTGRYLVVELKNTIRYREAYRPYQRQLALTAWLFCRTFYAQAAAHGMDALVLVVNAKGAAHYWLMEEALQWAKGLTRQLVTARGD